MPIRRVVTGEINGKAFFSADETVADIHIALMPGGAFTRVYGNNHLTLPTDGRENDTHNYFPKVGGAAVYIVVIPPDAQAAGDKGGQDLAELFAEVNAKLPGVLDVMSRDGASMHRTDTVDVATVLTGRIVLVLDGALKKELGPGDVVIQNGTRHAWRNPYDAPCTLHTVSIGVARNAKPAAAAAV
jgi:hypothetical protein